MQAPKRLSKEAKAKWAELAGSVDLSSPFTIESLAQWCEQWCIYSTAMAEVSAHVAATGETTLTQSTGVVGEHPAIGTATGASYHMRQIAKTLTLKDGRTADEWD